MFTGIKARIVILTTMSILALVVVACGTDEDSLIPGGNGGVGSRPTQSPTTQQPIDEPFETVEVLAPIESVQILVLESYPEQFVVQVISGLPSGCAAYSRYEVTQEGTEIKISVYNTQPAPGELIACTAIYGLNAVDIPLGSEFERRTTYLVHVNDHPAEKFTTGSSPLPKEDDIDFVAEPAPIEKFEIIMSHDSRGITAYHASLLWALTNGCKESLEPSVERIDDSTFRIQVLTKSPKGDVACTDDLRYDSTQVDLGVVGKELNPCSVYKVIVGRGEGELIETFQAGGPAILCAVPDETATPTPPASSGGGGRLIADSQALELTLESIGADVQVGGKSDVGELFGLLPTELKVNGERVVIFDFAPGDSAEKASETVSNDGTSFTNEDGSVMSVRWIAPPHFYLYGNSIVHYVGSDESVIDLLDSTLTKFAGDGVDAEPSDDWVYKKAVVEQVLIASTRSIPAQHNLNITVQLANGCEEIDSYQWHLEGELVIAEVTTRVPAGPVACTLAISYSDITMSLGADFKAGVEYDVIVNGERQGSFFGG